MSAIDRSLIIRGPALLQFKGANIYTKDSIELKGIIDTFDVETSIQGKVDGRAKSRKVEVTLTPCGMIDATLLSVLFPYGSLAIGSSIFAHSVTPANDNPAVIWTAAGKRITLYAAAITKMPSLTLAAAKTALGSMTLTGIRKNATDPTANNSMYIIEAVPWVDPGTFDKSKVRTGAYTGDWQAAGGWHNFESKEGWQVDFNLSLTPVETDGAGLVDMTLSNLEVTASCIPMPAAGGLDEDDILDGLPLQGANAAPGASLGGMSNTQDLAIYNGTTPNKFTVALTKAALKEGGLKFGLNDFRNGQCSWTANRDGTNALFTVGLS